MVTLADVVRQTYTVIVEAAVDENGVWSRVATVSEIPGLLVEGTDIEVLLQEVESRRILRSIREIRSGAFRSGMQILDRSPAFVLRNSGLGELIPFLTREATDIPSDLLREVEGTE